MLLMLMSIATGPVQLMINGEAVATNHGDYCSWARLPGITTEASGTPGALAWDVVFREEDLKRGFTGFLEIHDEHPIAAAPLPIRTDLSQPGQYEKIATFLVGCGFEHIEAPARAELFRKSGSGVRSVLARASINLAMVRTDCGYTQRSQLVEDAFACEGGKCEPLLERLTLVSGDALRCKPR